MRLTVTLNPWALAFGDRTREDNPVAIAVFSALVAHQAYDGTPWPTVRAEDGVVTIDGVVVPLPESVATELAAYLDGGPRMTPQTFVLEWEEADAA